MVVGAISFVRRTFSGPGVVAVAIIVVACRKPIIAQKLWAVAGKEVSRGRRSGPQVALKGKGRRIWGEGGNDNRGTERVENVGRPGLPVPRHPLLAD